MKSYSKFIFVCLTLLFHSISFGQKKDSLKPKRLSLIIASGFNNTFMGHKRLPKPPEPASHATSSSEENYNSNNNTLFPILPVFETGLNLRLKIPQSRDLFFHCTALVQGYESQFTHYYSYNYYIVGSYHDSTYNEQLNYKNLVLNLKIGFGLEFSFDNFYLKPQIWYSKEIYKLSTVNGYTDKEVNIKYSSYPPVLISSDYVQKNNAIEKNTLNKQYGVLSLEAGYNFSGRISRLYIKSGLGVGYTEKLYFIGMNINLW